MNDFLFGVIVGLVMAIVMALLDRRRKRKDKMLNRREVSRPNEG